MAYFVEAPVLTGSYPNLESAFNAQRNLGYWTIPESSGVRTFCGTNLREGAYVFRCTSTLYNTIRDTSLVSGSCCFLVLSNSPLGFSETTRRYDGSYFGEYTAEYSDRSELIGSRRYYYSGWYDNSSATPKLLYGVYSSLTEEINSLEQLYNILDSIPLIPINSYPITYSSSNSTVSGPSSAAIGDTVAVSAVPDVGYGITDASTQILVTNNDVAVPYTWDAANNRITFTMPDPS